MPSPYDNKINHAAGAAGEKLNSTCLDSCVDYKPTRFPTHNQSKQSLMRECFNLGSQRTRERVAIISVTKQADCSSRLCSQLLYVETEKNKPNWHAWRHSQTIFGRVFFSRLQYFQIARQTNIQTRKLLLRRMVTRQI